MKSIRKFKLDDLAKENKPRYLDDKEREIYLKREEWLENLTLEDTTETIHKGKITKYTLEKIIVKRGSLDDVMGIQKVWKKI